MSQKPDGDSGREKTQKLWIDRWIRNADSVREPGVRLQYSLVAGRIGIGCNLLLFGVKLFVGILTRSITVIVDSFNNLSDASSSVISVMGARFTSKPADQEHPFGHGRIEYIAAMVVAFVIMEVGLSAFKEALGKIRHPELLWFQIIPFCILLGSIALKGWMFFFYSRVARKIDSKLLMASAKDSRNDMIVTGVTSAVLLIYRLTGLNLDGIFGLAVSVFVMYSGFQIARDAAAPLIGGKEDPAICSAICACVRSKAGVIDVHDLILHNYGPGRNIASIHAEVPSDMTLETAHRILDEAEREVRDKYDVLLTIHADPVDIFDRTTQRLRRTLRSILDEFDPEVTFHDFRVILGKTHTNLIFDVVIPASYDRDRTDQLIAYIRQKMNTAVPNCHCHIGCDIAGTVPMGREVGTDSKDSSEKRQ